MECMMSLIVAGPRAAQTTPAHRSSEMPAATFALLGAFAAKRRNSKVSPAITTNRAIFHENRRSYAYAQLVARNISTPQSAATVKAIHLGIRSLFTISSAE